jgi:DNA (cytosine-5)-methyltransferase 1
VRYLSVCSGIEAVSVAWRPLGFTPVAVSEIDAFPCAVLAHHYPDTPNWGDMRAFQEWPDAVVDVLVGGTPCQSFSVAGLRAGLADPRGNLALTFLAIAGKYRPRWVVWENVPGVLSADSHDAPDPRPPAIDLAGDDEPADGTEVVVEDEYDSDENHAFACLLAGFSELGYFGAYGTLDAQYTGLAQRRKRLFAVFHLGDWHRAAAVLFESACLRGDPPPRRTAGEVAPTLASRRPEGGGLGSDFDYDGGLIAKTAPTLGQRMRGPIGSMFDGALIPEVSNPLTARMTKGVNTTCDEGQTMIVGAVSAKWAKGTGGPAGDECYNLTVAHSLRADGFDASEDGTGRGTPLVAFSAKEYGQDAQRDLAPTLRSGDKGSAHKVGIAEPFTLAIRGRGDSDLKVRQDGVANALVTPNGGRGGIGVGAVAFSVKDHGADAGDLAPTLRAGGHTSSHANGGVMPAVAFRVHSEHSCAMQSAGGARVAEPAEIARSLDTTGGDARNQGGTIVAQATEPPPVAFAEVADPVAANQARTYTREGDHNFRLSNVALGGMQVRRLTPRECERLQGFPDDYTRIPYRGKPAADGPRYKALGNSMAVPVVRWIGARIQQVEAIPGGGG